MITESSVTKFFFTILSSIVALDGGLIACSAIGASYFIIQQRELVGRHKIYIWFGSTLSGILLANTISSLIVAILSNKLGLGVEVTDLVPIIGMLTASSSYALISKINKSELKFPWNR
jgi:hypothetical protein